MLYIIYTTEAIDNVHTTDCVISFLNTPTHPNVTTPQVVFLFGSLLIGLTLTNLGVMLALVGATGSTMVSYVLPGFLYYLTFNDTGPAWKRNLAFFQGCMGLIIIPFCLTFIFV